MLLLGALSLAHADPAFFVAHLDPGVGHVLADAPFTAEVTGKVDVPLATRLVTTIPALLSLILGGGATVDDVLAPVPPVSPQLELFGSYRFDAGEAGAPAPWNLGGGLGLRFRPMFPDERLPMAARGLWLDVNARYGTRRWGVDAGVGLDLPTAGGLTIGPAITFVHEGAESRVVVTISFSSATEVEDPEVGRPVNIELGEG